VKLSKDILNELQEIAPALAKLDKKNFYQVSEGYFDDSTLRIVELVEDIKLHAIALPPVLSSIQKTELYDVPQGYFSSFTDRVISTIHAAEVAEEMAYTAPLLMGIPRAPQHAVPVNYFEMFPMIAAKLAIKDETAHDSPIEHSISRWSIWAQQVYDIIIRPRYTFVMACVTAAMVVMGVGFTHSTLTPEEKIFARMQQIPDKEIQHYMGRHRDEFDEHTILHNINDIEFTHYFDKPEDMPARLKNDIKIDDPGEDIID
jgi:hypothetical protein